MLDRDTKTKTIIVKQTDAFFLIDDWIVGSNYTLFTFKRTWHAMPCGWAGGGARIPSRHTSASWARELSSASAHAEKVIMSRIKRRGGYKKREERYESPGSATAAAAAALLAA